MNGLDKKIPDSNYSLIPNDLVLDSSLSGGAIKVYLYLASCPVGWIVKNSDVKEAIGVKSDSVISKYWQELIGAGWVTRKKGTPSSQNKCGYYDYVLMSSPNQQERSSTEDSPSFNKGEITTASKFEECSNLEKMRGEECSNLGKKAVVAPSLNLNIAPAPALAPAVGNYNNINNNNTSISLKEERDKEENINTVNAFSFGSFLFDGSENSKNAALPAQESESSILAGKGENRQPAENPDDAENEEEAFLTACQSVFGKRPSSGKPALATSKVLPSLPSGSAQSAPNPGDGRNCGLAIPNAMKAPEKGFHSTSSNSTDVELHAGGVYSKGDPSLFKLDSGVPPKGKSASKPAKKKQTEQMYFDYDDFVIKNIVESDLARWKAAYPAVDVDLEIKRAELWLKANPERRKKKIEAFLTRWFAKEQERGGSNFNRSGRNNRDETKGEWADRVLGKVITKKASPETIELFKKINAEGPF